MAVFQNNLLAGAGAQSSDSTHKINQSIRFNDDDSPYMSRTFGTATNAKKWTLSAWVKLHGITDGATGGVRLLDVGSPAGSEDLLAIGSGYAGYSKIYFWSRTSSSYDWRLETTAEYRDPSAWIHLTFVFDSDNTLSVERMRLFVNGERVTNFSSESYPSSGAASRINTAVEHRIGRTVYSSSNYSNGYAAEMVFLDGQALTCDSFGEFNSSGIWIPKDVSGLTFGNNGYHIDGRDSSDLGDDESGNGNDFATSGLAAHDQVPDSPTNNFATFNPLVRSSNTFSEGNLKVTNSSSTPAKFVSTIGVTSGKWFMEYHYNGNPNYPVGITADSQERDYLGVADDNTSVSFWTVSTLTALIVNGSSLSWSGSSTTWSSGDIIGLALNADDSIIAIYKNGSSIGSYDYSALNWTTTFFAGGNYISGNTYNANFGQDGTFAGLITAGGNSDGNGIGNFKYSVPSGYLALCTKNLGS